MQTRSFFLFSTITLCLIIPVESQAWYYRQHQIICEAAWLELTPSAKNMVLGLHKQANQVKHYNKFSDSCGWADEVRRSTHRATDEYHYVNVKHQAETFHYDRDCQANDCIVTAIKRYAAYLVNPATTKKENIRQANALRFLAHFIADIHQPLHVSYKEDRGGNAINVVWLNGERKNLHTVWDSLIPQEAGFSSFADARALLSEVSAESKSAWSTSQTNQWANESYQLTKNYVYHYANGRLLENGDTLSLGYVQRAVPQVIMQMQKAAVRLAYILNQIALGELSPDEFR